MHDEAVSPLVNAKWAEIDRVLSCYSIGARLNCNIFQFLLLIIIHQIQYFNCRLTTIGTIVLYD